MKTLLSFLLVFMGFFQLSAQNIPNFGFENWTPYSTGEYPDGWMTSDSITMQYLGGHSALSGIDSYEAIKCLHLKSTQINPGVTVTGPGIATNGIMSLNGLSFVFTGGSPTTARSRFFTGFYKYHRLGPNDVGSVEVYLFKYNGSTRDTIAAGISFFTDSSDVYAQFTTTMYYKNYVLQPDTCLIIFQSSKRIPNDPSIIPGTELIIDSINFSGFVGINELSDFINSVNVYPSPANENLNIEVELKQATSLKYEVFDLNGRLVKESLMNSNKERVDVGDLSEGNYILKLIDTKQNSFYSTSFVINR